MLSTSADLWRFEVSSPFEQKAHSRDDHVSNVITNRAQRVSFHHSLHWLLAELLKHVDLLTNENLQTFGFDGLRDVFGRGASEQAILTVIDFPLRGLLYIYAIILVEALIYLPSCCSTVYDRPNPHWPLGPQWLCHSGSTAPLS